MENLLKKPTKEDYKKIAKDFERIYDSVIRMINKYEHLDNTHTENRYFAKFYMESLKAYHYFRDKSEK